MSVPGTNAGPEKRLNGSDRRQKRKVTGRTNNNNTSQNKAQSSTSSNYNSSEFSRKLDRRRNRDDKNPLNAGPRKPQRNADSFTPSEVAATGAIVANPASLGYKKQNKAHRPKPKYLVPQLKVLTAPQFIQNKWDEENQLKMLEMEKKNSGLDYQGLYEELQAMREVERKNMELAGLVDAENTRKDLNDAISFQGTCQDMCPVFERVRRALENNVKALERDPTTKKISRNRAVKAFSRPAAGQPPPLPSEVRPPHVLTQTLDYLVDEIIPHLPDAHSFIWDRTRSIRQDFTYQNYFGPEAIDCNERIVRIHLISLHIMAGSDVEYSQQQELEQFNKALQTLMEIYQDVRNQGGHAPNEAEFRAYYLLSHIRDPELDRELQSLPDYLIRDHQIQLALMFRNLISQSNIVERGYKNSVGALNLYRDFFRLAYDANVPFLMSCLLETHFNVVRFYALKAISRAFHSKGKPYPVSQLAEVLGYSSTEGLEKFVQHYDIEIIEVDGQRSIDLFNREKLELTYKLNSIHDKAKQTQSFSMQLDNKLAGKLKDVINLGKSNDNLQLKNTVDQRVVQPKRPTATIKTPSEQRIEPRAGSLADFLSKGSDKPAQNKPSSSFGMPNNTNETKANQFPPVTFKTESRPKFEAPSLPNLTGLNERKELEQVEKKPSIPIFKPLEELKSVFGGTQSITKIESLTKPQESYQSTIELASPVLIVSRKLNEDPSFLKATLILANEFIQKCVENEILSWLPVALERERKRRARAKVLNSLSMELFDAFMSETIYQEVLGCMANEFYANSLKKRTLQYINKKVQKINQENQKKRSKLSELHQSSFHKPLRKRTSADSSLQSLSSSFVKRRSVDTKTSVANVSERRNEIKALWQPIDWSDFTSKCRTNLAPFSDNLSLKFVLIVKDWSSPYSKWLNTKLQLNLDRGKMVYEREIDSRKFHLQVTSLPSNDYLTKNFFKNGSFILFECGLVTASQLDEFHMDIVQKLESDAQTLNKIIQLTDRYSYYKAQILILYWDASETGLPIERVQTILQLSKWKQLENITNIVLCNMTSGDIDVNGALMSGFESLAKNFDGTLTRRGRRKLAETTSAKYPAAPTSNDTFKEQEKSVIQSALDAKRYDYLSNHLKWTSTGKVLTSANSSFMQDNTTGMNISRLSGFGQGVIEESTPSETPEKVWNKPNNKSLQQLRDLTASVRQKYKHT